MSAGKRIVVIEDEVAIRESLVAILADEGYDAVGYANGREALDALSRDEVVPRVVLLDLLMPVMDGAAFRRAQLADPRLARVPTVVLSANAGLAEKAASMEAAGFAHKPINLDQLLALIARHSS